LLIEICKIMKIKLIILGVLLSLIIAAIPFGCSLQVYADDKQPESQERNVIDPNLEKILSGMSPTDNISVIVMLRLDPNINDSIYNIKKSQPYDEMDRISESIKERYRKVSQAMGPYEEQLRAGDPTATALYNELLEKYELTHDSRKAEVERLSQLQTAQRKQVYSLLEQTYSDMQQQAKQRIEQLPDTKVTSSTFILNSLAVKTKVGNIETIATIPDVIKIFPNSRGVPDIISYHAPIPLSPGNNSLGAPVDQPSFSWSPFKETTKYKFVLAKDAAVTQIVKEAEVTATSYDYDSKLDYSINYFWRVQALEPAPSDWSATFSFQTEAFQTKAAETETQQPASKWKTFFSSIQQKIKELWHR
ncbi:MAG: hypothetical protein JSV54_09315, partial [Chloroflexota bacterium]